MATMNITVSVICNGTIWRRTASIEVDTASIRDGSTSAFVFGAEAETPSLGMHSYSGIAVGVFANKAKGSIGSVLLNNGSTVEMITGLVTYLPLIVYSGAGTGFTGAFNTGATATDVPDEDVATLSMSVFIGTQKTTAIVGLKAIS
jgi:hypothetical protein